MSPSQDGKKDEPALIPEEVEVAGDLFSLAYEELRKIASARKGGAGAALSSAALLHEAWFKLQNSPKLKSVTVPHFKAIAAKAMRRIVIDAARKNNARKRGGAGEIIFVSLDDAADRTISRSDELLALDSALDELARRSPRLGRMVEYRFFGGLDVAETAELLGVSESAVNRDWKAAKAWLAGKIRPNALRSQTE